jgi:4-amino-4-deoxy-L-arabinose transferase-like glycosyltransferase
VSRKPATARIWPVWLLPAVLLLGLGLRVANLADLRDSPFYSRPVIDGQAYDTWAMAIVSHKAPAQPFYQDPLYPYILAGVYTVFGHSLSAVYLVQLCLALVLLLLIYDTARLLFDRRAGLVAAGMAALYKPFIFYESQIEKTALAVFLIGLLVWTFVRAVNSRRLIWPLCSGLALGLAALTRANVLLFAPLLPVAIVLASRQRTPGTRPRVMAAGLSVLGVLAVVAPVVVRNTVLAREFTLTTTQSGQNLYIGNSRYNNTGQYQAPPWVRPNPEYEQADFAEYARKARGADLSPAATSRFYTRAAIDWMRTHPAESARLLWRKTILYFNNFEVPDNQDIYFFSRYSWVLRLPLLSFGLVLALGLAAMVLLARGLDRLSLVVFFFGYAASVIAFFVFSRYRIPALPALLPFAGAMLPWLGDAARLGPSPLPHRPASFSRLAGGLVLIVASLTLTLYPVHRGSGKNEAAQCLANLASMYYHEGDTTRAVATYEEALKTAPAHGEASRNLGIIMMNRGRLDRALALLTDAVKSEPGSPVAHAYLGRLYQMRRQPENAYLQFRDAVRQAPGRVEYRFELATCLQQLQNYDAALAQYDTMIQLEPRNPKVRHNYAVALYNRGRLAEARVQLEQARSLGGPVNPKFDSLLNPKQR